MIYMLTLSIKLIKLLLITNEVQFLTMITSNKYASIHEQLFEFIDCLPDFLNKTEMFALAIFY